jgi:hypothetical protein
MNCFGIVGFIQGIGKMVLRGFVDTFMFWVVSRSNLSPIYIWNDFDIKTYEKNDPSIWVCDKK